MLRVMKKVLVNIISILSLIVVIVSSCTKENQEQNGNILGSRKITATFDDNTKTALGSGNKPKWSVGDEIWVSDGTNSASIKLTESDIDIKTATTFEITLPNTITGSKIYAVYTEVFKAFATIIGEKYSPSNIYLFWLSEGPTSKPWPGTFNLSAHKLINSFFPTI